MRMAIARNLDPAPPLPLPRSWCQVVDEYGLPAYFESDAIQVSGLVVTSYSADHSHWNSNSSLGEWLASAGVPAIFGVDTRALTKRIRDRGATLAALECGPRG